MKTLSQCVRAAAVLWAAGGVLTAQVAPQREPLPNFDGRQRLAAAPDLAKDAALQHLQGKVAGLVYEKDELWGGARFLHARSGFLTGTNGSGTVSAAALAAFSGSDSNRVIKAFLNENVSLLGHGAEAVEAVLIKRDYVDAHNGLRTVVWQQQVDGIPVHGQILKTHLTAKGEIVNLSSTLLPNVKQAADQGTPARVDRANPPVTAGAAVAVAAQSVGDSTTAGQVTASGAASGAEKKQNFTGAGLKGEGSARLVWLATTPQELRLCWNVNLMSQTRSEMFEVLVDAQTGEVLLRNGLTQYISDATYNVWTSDSPSPFSPGHSTPSPAQPPFVSRTLVTTNALSVLASPNGWINDGVNETLGNNVDAHLDHNDDDQPDLPRPTGSPERVFDFPIDLAQAPASYGNGAVVSLFYWNNWMHDKLYEFGFTEAAGNFQTDNFGRGGFGGDAILADGQDGAGGDLFHVNNANMSTGSDGNPPRMQMYLFNGPNPDRDGDLDAEVMLHEHTHGLSQRLVGGGGGLFNLQGGGMGEGWSDFYAMTLLSQPGDDVDGAYPSGGYVTRNFFGLQENYYYGIRRYPYSTDLTKNPLTFKDIDPTRAIAHDGVPRSPLDIPFNPNGAPEVHNQGEVWCTALWEVRANLIRRYGHAEGTRLTLQLVTDGLKLTPPSPTFLDARDAILQADQVYTGGGNFAEIWTGFAKRGMGISAVAPAPNTTTGVLEAFDVPGLSLRGFVVSGGNGNGLIDPNECNDFYVVLTNFGPGAASNLTATLLVNTPGVVVAQKHSPYPNLPVGAGASNQIPFRVSTTPSFACGTAVDFALVLDRGGEVTTNQFFVQTGQLGAPIRLDNNVPVGVPDNNPAGAVSTVVLTNFTGTVGKVSVSLYIAHTFDADLKLELIAPDGTTVVLSANNGGSGDNYGTGCGSDATRTVFDDDAPVSITSATPPYLGVYKPEQPLAIFRQRGGGQVNGVWQLKVTDSIPIDLASIVCWSLNISPNSCVDGGGTCPGADLGLNMKATPSITVINSNVVFTMQVTNFGPSTAKGVQLNQTLPANFVYLAGAASQGSVAVNGSSVVANLGNIEAFSNAVVTVTAKATANGTYLSTASVASNEADPDPANNSASVLLQVSVPTADLSVGVVDSPDPVAVGSQLTYLVTVTNAGPVAANNVVVSNVLPVTAVLSSVTVSQGSSVDLGGAVLCQFGTLNAGANASATIKVVPNSARSIVMTATAKADQLDPQPANNVFTATTVVSEAADLAISLVDTPDPVVRNSNFTYVVTITNKGPSTATNVVVSHTLPGSIGVVLISTLQGAANRSGSIVTWTLPTLSAGASSLMSVVATNRNPDTLTSTATVTSSLLDANPADNTATATTVVTNAFVSVQAAGATIVLESQVPTNGAVDFSETVTVSFRLRNAGNVGTTNVVATLLATGGVGTPSPAQAFGPLAAAGGNQARNFTFVAPPPGILSNITASFQLQDIGATTTGLGTVTFVLPLPMQKEFTNATTIFVPATNDNMQVNFLAGPAGPYPSTITVSNLTGFVSRVSVTLSNVSHTFPDDMDVLLVGPGGQKLVLLSDVGGPNGLNGVTFSVDDQAAAAFSDGDAIVPGSYRPADFEPGDIFSNAPAGLAGTNFGVFSGVNPNGAWSLYVVDDHNGDIGSIAGGWRLAVTTVLPLNKVADLSVTGSTPTNTVYLGEAVTFRFAISNLGPDAASSVAFTNVLPAGFAGVSASATLGTFSLVGNTISGFITDLATNTNAVVTVLATAVAPGTVTNTATLRGNEGDLNTGNNTARVPVVIAPTTSDLSVSFAGLPASVTVGDTLTYVFYAGNNGPQTATGVVLSNVLTGGVSIQSYTAGGTVAGNTVAWNLGNLSAGTVLPFYVTVQAVGTGTLTSAATLTTAAIDPVPANNTALATVLALPPLPSLVAAGASLVSENVVPPNGLIDAGETVTVKLVLKNLGQLDTANLTATLQANGGVTAPSGAQNYGVIPVGQTGTNTFTFTAAGNATAISATLALVDGAYTQNVTFNLGVAKTTTFTNATAIVIPASGVANPYPSVITVSGQSGLVSKVSVQLRSVTHGFPDDLDVLLVSPNGQKVILTSDAGGGLGLTNVTLGFDDAAAVLPDSSLLGGTYHPGNFEAGDVFPGTAAGPAEVKLSAFVDGIPNGDWKLYVVDDASGDAGSIGSGWMLSVTAGVPPGGVKPRIRTVTTLPGGFVQIFLTGEPGASYEVESSFDLVTWTMISTLTTEPDGTSKFTDTDAPSHLFRYYRLKKISAP